MANKCELCVSTPKTREHNSYGSPPSRSYWCEQGHARISATGCADPVRVSHLDGTTSLATDGYRLAVDNWNSLQAAIRAAKAEAWDEGEEAGTTNMRHDSRLTNPYTEQESENHE